MCTLGKGEQNERFLSLSESGLECRRGTPYPHFHSFKEYAKHQSLLETMSFPSLGNKNLQ